MPRYLDMETLLLALMECGVALPSDVLGALQGLARDSLAERPQMPEAVWAFREMARINGFRKAVQYPGFAERMGEEWPPRPGGPLDRAMDRLALAQAASHKPLIDDFPGQGGEAPPEDSGPERFAEFMDSKWVLFARAYGFSGRLMENFLPISETAKERILGGDCGGVLHLEKLAQSPDPDWKGPGLLERLGRAMAERGGRMPKWTVEGLAALAELTRRDRQLYHPLVADIKESIRFHICVAEFGAALDLAEIEEKDRIEPEELGKGPSGRLVFKILSPKETCERAQEAIRAIFEETSEEGVNILAGDPLPMIN